MRQAEAVRRFANLRVTVIGDAILDAYIFGEATRLSPEAPVPVVKQLHDSTGLGGAANVAANASALGAQVSLIGAVGEDANATELSNLLRLKGIQNHLLADPSTITSKKTRVTAQQQQVVRIDTEDPGSVTEGQRTMAGAYVAAALHKEQTDLVLVADYNKGMLNRELVRSLCQACPTVPVVADPKPMHLEWFSGITAITPNLSEATEAVLPETFETPFTLASAIATAQELQAALITCGSEGMVLCGPEWEWGIHAVARSVFDVTGAGDTVTAVFGMGIAAGLDLEDAAVVANTAAGLVVERFGCATVTPDELIEALHA